MTREEALEAALLKCGQYIGHAGDCALVSMCQPCDCNMGTALYSECMAALAMPKDDNFKAFRDAYIAEMRKHEGARLLRVAEAVLQRCLDQCDGIYTRDRMRLLDLAAIVEGVK